MGPHEFGEDLESALSKGTWQGVRNAHTHMETRRDLLKLGISVSLLSAGGC